MSRMTERGNVKKSKSEIIKKIDKSKILAVKEACACLLPNCGKGTDVIESSTKFGCNGATFKTSEDGNDV